MTRAASHPALALVLLALACSSAPPISARDAADANDTGGALAPKNDSERALLKVAGSLPSDVERRVGTDAVVAAPAYAAASGRTCRALHVTAANTQRQHRLACSDGKAWFFAPSVFGSGN